MPTDNPAPETPPPPPDPLLGKVINSKFRLVSLIGRGGMGKIFKAEQLSLGRTVAIKLLSIVDKTSNVAEFRERFYREASLCARLSHPNIVTIHDYGSVEGAADETLWIAMEYLEGKTLMQRVKANRQLSPQEATSIVIEIARGVREAHKHGIVHRDLKCSNVMLVADEDGGTRIKILDFGLVKSLTVDDQDDALTIAGGGFLGSPGYMSPEQIQRGMPIDHRTDIYSLGVILFRCLAGRNPYEGDQAQVLLAHVGSPLPTLKEANPNIDVPPQLETFLRRMLEKQAERRVSSAEEVVRTLREIQEQSGWREPRATIHDTTMSFSKPQVLVLDPTPTTGGSINPVAVSQTAPQPKNRYLKYAVAGGAALLVALAVVTLPRRASPPPPPSSLPQVSMATAKAPEPPPPVVAPPVVVAPPPPPAPVEAVPEVAAVPPPRAAPRPPVRRPAPAKGKPAPVAISPVTPVAPPPPPPRVAAPPASAETGFLSLDTTPWSTVSEGSHVIGQTPLIRVKMSEGAHTLTLTTERGSAKTFIVNIKPGQTTSKRLGLE